MLSESDRKDFKNLTTSYKNVLSALRHKEDEIFRFSEKCGAYTDWRKLAKIILALPVQSRVRSKLIQKYYELRDEPPWDLEEWPPLERKTQIVINTLASAYNRFLRERHRLHHEILDLARERGVFEDEDSMKEILSFINTFCFLRILLVRHLKFLQEEQADQRKAALYQKEGEPCSEEPAPFSYPQQSM